MALWTTLTPRPAPSLRCSSGGPRLSALRRGSGLSALLRRCRWRLGLRRGPTTSSGVEKTFEIRPFFRRRLPIFSCMINQMKIQSDKRISSNTRNKTRHQVVRDLILEVLLYRIKNLKTIIRMNYQHQRPTTNVTGSWIARPRNNPKMKCF